MGSLIHELDNDALLTMYLADELSDEDRADVEQLLGVDVGLRAGLAAVRADSAAATSALAAGDRFDPPAGLSASAEAAAMRWVGRTMRQRQVEVLVKTRAAAAIVEPRVTFPRWAVQTATAAAVLLSIVVWWGYERRASRHGDGGMPNGVADNRPVNGGTSFMMVGDAFGGQSGSTPGLADAEYEASTLRHDGDPSQMPSLLGDVTDD